MTTQTINHMRELRLGAVANAFEQQLTQVSTFEALPFAERLSLLLEHEILMRDNRKQDRLVRQAKFKLCATVQEIEYSHPRNIQKKHIAQLATGDWLERHQNLPITGPCGRGETYLACALGHSACL